MATVHVGSSSDNVFGPKLAGHFDFTLLFEQTTFSMVPSVVSILAIPIYLRLAMTVAPPVRPSLLLGCKIGAGFALLAINATSLALWQRSSIFYSNLAVPAASLSLVSSFCVLIILYISHMYSIRTSSFLSLFLVVTLLFDIISTRSCYLREGLNAIGALQICTVAIKLVLAILEEVPKRGLLYSEALRASVSKETAAGFWNRAVFAWLNRLLIFGFSHDLKIDDLPTLDIDLFCLEQHSRFAPNWDRVDKCSTFALPKALLRTVAWEAAKILLPRLIFVGLTFSQPFLLFSVVHAVNGELNGETARSLILATLVIYVGKAMSRSVYEHRLYRIVTGTRGILVVAIYRKIQQLPIEQLEKSAAITLMTTGSLASEQMLSLLYEICSCAIQIALGIWALNLYVGYVCFFMFLPGIISFTASHFIGKAMGKARAAWNLEMESRVAATSNVLAQMKGIKSMGLATMIAEYLQAKRRHEVKVSLKERNTRIWHWGFHALGRVLPPTLILAGANFWTRVSNPLDVAEVFTVVAISIVAAEPFQALLSSFVAWASSLASLRRVQEFLCMEEIQDQRIILDKPRDTQDSIIVEKQVLTAPRTHSTSTAVQFDDVNVAYPVTGQILKNVSFSIPWGKLAIVWGPIASGKSTLLRCVLGETKLSSGSVKVGAKSIGYCNQQSWIRNTTLRDNITGVLAYVEAWYLEVVIACGLDIDIRSMVNGDQVMTGTAGCNLSGGQKQRLSLARAVYEQTDVLVLDDVLSGLDPTTAKQVFKNLFGPEGLVRRWGCTVILTTNQLEFLDDADLVFQIHKGGHVEQQPIHIPAAVPSSAGTDDKKDDKTGGSKHQQSENTGRISQSSDSSGYAPAAATEKMEPPSVKPSAMNFELRNAREKKKYGDWSLYTYYLGAAGTFVVWFWVTFQLTCIVSAELPTIFIKIWYGKDPENFHYFFGYVGLSVATIVLHSLSGVLFFYHVLPKCSEEMHLRLLLTVMFATPQFLSQTDVGQLLNHFAQDVFLTSQFLPITLTQTFYVFFSGLVDLGIIASGSKYAAPIMLFLIVVIYGLQYFYLRTSRQLRLLELESASDLYTHYAETSTGIHLIRSFRWKDKFLGQLSVLLDKSQRPTYSLFCCQRWLHTVLDFTVAAAALILVTLCILRPEEVSAGGVALALISIISFYESASFLVISWTNLETGLGAVSRIKTFCAETPCEPKALLGSDLEETSFVNGRLDFEGVTVDYKLDDGSVQKALNNITFTVFPGEKVAISGRTGSGKSSMLMTILHMTDYTGTIKIDGLDTRSVPREALRSQITTLTQDGVELKGSIRFNLYPFLGPKPDSDLTTLTLQSVGLLDYINQRGGLDVLMSAIEFSVSQKQLLFLARGILHHKTLNTKIIVMDEATSAMDHGTDDALQNVLDEAFAGCTILQIAHREDTFRNVDLRISLNLGQLASIDRRGIS